MDEVIAQRELLCIDPTGHRVPVAVRVGRPKKRREGDWSCPIEIAGPFDVDTHIFGTDSLQALVLAQRFAANLLASHEEKGARFRDSGDTYDVHPNELFAGDA